MSKRIFGSHATSGFPSTLEVSDKNWKLILTLKDQTTGYVELTNGNATVNGDAVFITQPSPGGSRIYEFDKSEVFKEKKRRP